MHARADALQGVKRGQPGCETQREGNQQGTKGSRELLPRVSLHLQQPQPRRASRGGGSFGEPHPVVPKATGHSEEMLGDAMHLFTVSQLPRAGWPKRVCVYAPCPPSSLALPQSRRLTHLLNQRSSPRPLPRPPSFKDINILLLFIGRNMQMNACGKALESSNVNKTSKQGLSSLRVMLTQYTSVVLQSITS